MSEPFSSITNEAVHSIQGAALPVAEHQRGTGALRQILKRIFSFPVMLAFMLAVLAVISVRLRFDDPDLWWHLKIGEIIWTTHSIPLHDIFSYTTNHQATVPQEWLGELSIYFAYKLGGYSGLMLWMCIFASAIFIAGYALCTTYGGNLKVAFAGAILIWFFSTIGLSIRPQMIGYLLLIVELFLIHLGRTRNPRWFLCLPILFVLWINCHASFFLGIVVAVIYLASSFVHFEAGSLLAPRWDSARRRMLTIGLVISGAALFLNPDGIHQVAYPVNTLLHQHIQMASVQEWQPTQISDPRGIALLVVLLGSFMTVVLRNSELYFEELLILAAATWLGLSHERTLFAFGILAAPILCRQIAGLWESYERDKDPHWLNAAMMAASLLAMFLAFPSAGDLHAQVQRISPVGAVTYIKSHHLAGPMLNDYTYGGYLIWTMPEHPVFVDGRGDPFEDSGVLLEFGEWAMLQADPQALLRKYKINFCLLDTGAPMVQVLKLLPEWKDVYSDDHSVIFVRRGAAAGADQTSTSGAGKS